MHRFLKAAGVMVVCLAGAGLLALAIPAVVVRHAEWKQEKIFSAMSDQFPVTVNPTNKEIRENQSVNAFLERSHFPLAAAAAGAGEFFWQAADVLASGITNASWYQPLAAVSGRVVNIDPGMRKEQVADAFASAAKWDSAEKKEFLSPAEGASLPLFEGSFSPGVYLVGAEITPAEAQSLVNKRFSETVLSHYGTTTAAIVPMEQALVIASMIEREAGGTGDMRIISGIIWNRLFSGMKLQIDATLQYAKANKPSTRSWWPVATPKDRFIKSPYNTYLSVGLPPTPIANPSVASVLAALNPRETSCFYYFHDANGRFHCSDTYEQHVKLLKQYYGRGK